MEKECLRSIKSGMYGLCVGDAVGVPAEFKSRKALKEKPVTDMIGGGTHAQPKGTWSDDSSMALCLAASIAETGEIRINDIMERFMEWFDKGKYSPWGTCFGCGRTVGQALFQFYMGTPAALCGGDRINSNGNGSLMRILPMAYALYPVYSPMYGADLTKSNQAMEQIHEVSGLTHRHALAQSACGIYVNIATRLIADWKLEDAIKDGISCALEWYRKQDRFQNVEEFWKRILDVECLRVLPEEDIKSGGYVVETLEAALWCLLNTDNYRDCVLKAVNLGRDTDTTAAVAGGLAGLAYGYEKIPKEWIQELAGKNLIEECCEGLQNYWNHCSCDSKCSEEHVRHAECAEEGCAEDAKQQSE